MSTTVEQREERRWLAEFVAATGTRHRVVDDPEGWPMIPRRLGNVERGVGSVSLDDASDIASTGARPAESPAGRRSARAREVAAR